MIWIFIIYVLIGVIVGYRNRNESYGSDAFWLGVGWPLMALLFVFLFLLDAAGFRIH